MVDQSPPGCTRAVGDETVSVAQAGTPTSNPAQTGTPTNAGAVSPPPPGM